MAAKVIFENLILKGMNKGGVLKPDEKGYYPCVVGVLGADDSIGEHYTINDRVRQVFANSSQLNRRASEGLLRGEFGHPDPMQYANQLAFEIRVRRIDEKSESHHIRRVWLEDGEIDGRKVTLIMADVRPQGPYGKFLKDALDNPDCNVAFSGRYYSNPNKVGNKVYREIYAVGTFDYVTEPGLRGSTKYNSPQLQSASVMMLDIHQIQSIVGAEKSMSSQLRQQTMQSGGLTAQQLYGDIVPQHKPRKALTF